MKKQIILSSLLSALLIGNCLDTVSYTHLTLPTKLEV